MFRDPSDADVLFLGSSLVRAAIDKPALEQALSTHLGRPAKVDILALNWQGIDLQYFLLRDFLQAHHVGLIVWNLPVPGSRSLFPHVEAFRWARFGEYSDALSGLPIRYRLALYGDMVLGAPRELLSHLRPNLLSREESDFHDHGVEAGYYGAKFVPQPADLGFVPALGQLYEAPPYPQVRPVGAPLNPYEDHFARKILDLAKQTQTTIVLLHIPIDSERGMDYIPERARWCDTLQTDAPMIGPTSEVLFEGISPAAFYDFYRDQHFNVNGTRLFTRSIVPAILRAYDDRKIHE
jgi:hypothetical protein